MSNNSSSSKLIQPSLQIPTHLNGERPRPTKPSLELFSAPCLTAQSVCSCDQNGCHGNGATSKPRCECNADYTVDQKSLPGWVAAAQGHAPISGNSGLQFNSDSGRKPCLYSLPTLVITFCELSLSDTGCFLFRFTISRHKSVLYHCTCTVVKYGFWGLSRGSKITRDPKKKILFP